MQMQMHSFFRITRLKVNKKKLFELTASICFHVFVYPCCLNALYKVVFFLLIESPTTVRLREIMYFTGFLSTHDPSNRMT